MKRAFITLTLALTAILVTAQTPNFRLTANLPGTERIIVTFSEFQPERKTVADTLNVVDGRIEYKKVIPHAVWASIRDERQKDALSIYLFPGEELRLDGSLKTVRDITEIQISGSPFYQSLAQIKAGQKPFLIEQFAIKDSVLAGIMSKEEAKTAMRDCNQRLDNWKLEYVLTHTDSPAAFSLVNFLDPWALEAMEAFSDEVKNGPVGPVLQVFKEKAELLKRQQKAALAKAEKQAEEGQPMPDFILKQPDGNSFDSKTLRGKFAVIDFWGSWCAWCIKGIPQMRDFYARHADRIQFVSIACSDTDALWRRALAKHPMPWPQVISPDGVVEKQFDVTVYPTKAVIAPDGRLLKIFKGEKAEFYDYLEEIL